TLVGCVATHSRRVFYPVPIQYHRERKLFFFQAEDGIRDDLVTGVQTCALPISSSISSITKNSFTRCSMLFQDARMEIGVRNVVRSEERRVGKGCRCRVSAQHKSRNGRMQRSRREQTDARISDTS